MVNTSVVDPGFVNDDNNDFTGELNISQLHNNDNQSSFDQQLNAANRAK